MIRDVQSLLFMPDYGADPVWDLATEAMINVDSLPIAYELREALRAWAKRWELLAWAQMSFDDVQAGMPGGRAEPVPTGAWEQVDHDGRVLCARLRQEIGAGWRVGWVSFHRGRRHVQWESDGPVELCLPGSGKV